MDQITQKLDELLGVLKSIDSKTQPVREVMSLPEAARYLDQSEHTIREWVRLRKIPYFKVNGSIKFRKSKLDKWIDKCEVPTLNQNA